MDHVPINPTPEQEAESAAFECAFEDWFAKIAPYIPPMANTDKETMIHNFKVVSLG